MTASGSYDTPPSNWGRGATMATQFGSIALGGVVYDHDVLARPDSTVKRRKKKLSKAVYGTSHTISLAELSMSTGRVRERRG